MAAPQGAALIFWALTGRRKDHVPDQTAYAARHGVLAR